MSQHIVKINSINKITNDVLKIVTEKPVGYHFIAGQAAHVSINKDGWKEAGKPYTFTSLPQNEYLEFIIKTDPKHKDFTGQILTLKKEDELILDEAIGTFRYKGDGIFIADGAGIIAFISIFRLLESQNKIGDNKLIFANKTKSDIILEQELKSLFGSNLINILSEEKVENYASGQITGNLIKQLMSEKDIKFYVCGPAGMINTVTDQLAHLGVDDGSINKEVF